MSSTVVTHFFGQAMTGQGMKNVYQDVMNEAKVVYLLKGAHGFKVFELLQKLGSFYESKGLDIEYFHDPLFEETIEALFINAPHPILIVQATNPALEPVVLGARDHVISLYDCVDEHKLLKNDLFSLHELKKQYFEKCFTALSKAIHIHDDWENETRKNMNWRGLNQQLVILPELKFCIFDSTEPHVYFPDKSRSGDEIFDIAKHCHPTAVEENNIKLIVEKYKANIAEAKKKCWFICRGRTESP